MNLQHVLYLITLFMVFSCHGNDQKQKISSNDNIDTTGIMNDSISSNYNNIGKYYFNFNTNKTGDSLLSISIHTQKGILQKISVNEPFMKGENNYQLIDLNFDGYKDIKVLKDCGSGGKTFWVWNFSAEDKIFHFNNELSDKFGLEVDSVNKFVMFHYRAGYSEETWDTLKYIKNKLSLYSETYQERWRDSSGDYWTKQTHSRIINNQRFITVDSFISKR